MKNFVKNYEDYKKAIKEGISIFELEDETVDAPEAAAPPVETEEQAAATETPAADAAPAEPIAETPADETPAEEPAAPEVPAANLDLGATAMNPELFSTKLQFVQDMLNQYKKYSNKDQLDITDGMKQKISDIFDIMSK